MSLVATRPDFLSGIRAVITGIEGLIETEILHYRKWLNIAEAEGVFSDKESFQQFWRKNCIGIGDKGVYDALRNESFRNDPERKYFFSWEECKHLNNKYYLDFLEDASVPDGMRASVDALRSKGVPVVIVTHAPRALTKEQLKYVAPPSFDNKDIILDRRKDNDAYFVAYCYIKNLIPDLRPDEILVLDNSAKYLKRAEEFGMQAASIANDHPDYLKPLDSSGPAYPSVTWTQIKDAVEKGQSLGAKPKGFGL